MQKISDEAAQLLNYAVEAKDEEIHDVAREFLRSAGLLGAAAAAADPVPASGGRVAARAGAIAWLAVEHLTLTAVAVLLAALLAIPLGIACVSH